MQSNAPNTSVVHYANSHYHKFTQLRLVYLYCVYCATTTDTSLITVWQNVTWHTSLVTVWQNVMCILFNDNTYIPHYSMTECNVSYIRRYSMTECNAYTVQRWHIQYDRITRTNHWHAMCTITSTICPSSVQSANITRIRLVRLQFVNIANNLLLFLSTSISRNCHKRQARHNRARQWNTRHNRAR